MDYLTQKKRVKYTYDLGGNILSESIYTLSGDTESFDKTITYTYDEGCWGDKLKVYNKKDIEYDTIGNPTKYRDDFEFSWSNGRQLNRLKQGDLEVRYTYDDTGLRLSKTVNGVEYTYLYEGGLLVQETRDKKVFDYSYDASGNLTMLRYKSSPTASALHLYVLVEHNLQFRLLSRHVHLT